MAVKLDTKKLDGMIADAPAAFSRIVRESAFAISSDAAQRAPKDTTALAQSLLHGVQEISQTLYRVQDGVEYGLYQELGFVHWRSGRFIQNPFMIPAVEKERPIFNRKIAEFFRR